MTTHIHALVRTRCLPKALAASTKSNVLKENRKIPSSKTGSPVHTRISIKPRFSIFSMVHFLQHLPFGLLEAHPFNTLILISYPTMKFLSSNFHGLFLLQIPPLFSLCFFISLLFFFYFFIIDNLYL